MVILFHLKDAGSRPSLYLFYIILFCLRKKKGSKIFFFPTKMRIFLNHNAFLLQICKS
jgi:hypothetical protein